MNLGLCIVGIVLVAAASVDAFLTVLSLRAGGPLTNLWTRGLWTALLRLHAYRPIHRLLSITGPIMLIGALLIWYVLLFTGWFCVFASAEEAVLHAKTGRSANPAELIYFTGTTVSSLGYGDLLPRSFPWTLLATTATAMGTFLVTLSLSYLISVVSAALERIHFAEEVFALGDNPYEMLETIWPEANATPDSGYVLGLLSSANKNLNKQLSYPILRYFHQPAISKASSLAMLNLSDTVFLATCALAEEHRPAPSFSKVCWRIIERYAEQATVGDGDITSIEEWQMPDYCRLQTTGLHPVDRKEFSAALEDYIPIRLKLLHLCLEDGRHRELARASPAEGEAPS